VVWWGSASEILDLSGSPQIILESTSNLDSCSDIGRKSIIAPWEALLGENDGQGAHVDEQKGFAGSQDVSNEITNERNCDDTVDTQPKI
jgi:hypothetical protein